MSKVIKGNVNKAKFIIEIPQYDGTYTNYRFNSLEELTNEWNQYIRLRPFYKITYVSFDYNQNKTSHTFNTNYTDNKSIIDGLNTIMKYPIFHLMDKNGNKIYYKNYNDNSYEKVYDNSNLHNTSEYVSVNNLFCSFGFFSTELQKPKKYITMTITSMPDNEVIGSCMFENHIPEERKQYNVSVTMCKNFTPLPEIEYCDNNSIDFVENNYSAIKLGDAHFINADLELNKDSVINFINIENKKLMDLLIDSLDDIQILYVTVDNKKTKWYRYYKPLNKLSESVCEKYMEGKSESFSDFCKRYKPYYQRYTKKSFLVIPTIKQCESKDKIYKTSEILKPMYWNDNLGGWISSLANENVFTANNLVIKRKMN
jgi:hypothetical protein